MEDWHELTNPLEGTEIDGAFGSALSMTPDGRFTAVGSDRTDSGGDEDSGSVAVYKLEGDTWKLLDNTISGPGEQVRLGINDVPISDDGQCFATGGNFFQNKTGVCYLFQLKNETWESVAQVVGDSPGDRFGGSSAISGDCKWVAWGANQKESEEGGSGYVKVFSVDELIS